MYIVSYILCNEEVEDENIFIYLFLFVGRNVGRINK